VRKNIYNLGGRIWEEESGRKNLGGRIWEEESGRKNLGGRICITKLI